MITIYIWTNKQDILKQTTKLYKKQLVNSAKFHPKGTMMSHKITTYFRWTTKPTTKCTESAWYPSKTYVHVKLTWSEYTDSFWYNFHLWCGMSICCAPTAVQQWVVLYFWLFWCIFDSKDDWYVHTIVTCSGVTGKTSPATFDWFQIVQTNSVCSNYHVVCIPMSKPWMVGKLWFTQYAEWISGSLINFFQ